MRTSLLLCFVLSFVGGCRAPLVVGSDFDSLPFAGVNEAGEPIGRDVEMMQRLASDMDREIEWRRMPFDELLDAVEAGEIDVACATLGHTPERAKRVGLTQSYFQTELAIVGRVAQLMGMYDEIGELRAAEGRSFGVSPGTVSERAVRQILPNAEVVHTEGHAGSSLEFLMRGEASNLVMDKVAALALRNQSREHYGEPSGWLGLPWEGAYILDEPLAHENYVLAVRPDDPELLAELNRGIFRLQQVGALDYLDLLHGVHESRP